MVLRDTPKARATAERRHLAFFEHAQQARLQGERHVADLVEEQCAATGLRDAADGTFLARARECAFFVAQQFGFDQRFRDGRAVHGDEGAMRAWRGRDESPGPADPCRYPFRQRS
jgi:hypothetical protein